jgi:hypothetical protein
MSHLEPQGCLGTLAKLLGIKLPARSVTADSLPFGLRDDFLSPAELSFFHVLRQVVADRAVICTKVNLADLFFVSRPNENQGYRNKIDRKHADFVLCDTKTMRPLCAIELDDNSHSRRDRAERDHFVNEVFKTVGLPLLRIPAERTYNVVELRERLLPFIATS